MIRGAIAFGLVLRMDESLPNREVIITTSLCLVIVTTVVCGSSMPIMTKFLLKQKKAPPAIKSGDHEMQSMSEGSSFHEIFVHPNEASLLPEEKEAEKKQGGCVKFFKRMDE